MVAAPKKQIISWQSKIKAENKTQQMQISAKSFSSIIQIKNLWNMYDLLQKVNYWYRYGLKLNPDSDWFFFWQISLQLPYNINFAYVFNFAKWYFCLVANNQALACNN